MFVIHGTGLKPDDPYLYPSKMHEYIIEKFPMTVIATGEFDQFHAEAKKFANRLSKHDRLSELLIYPGSVHSFMGFDHSNHYVWQDVMTNFKKWVDCYLRP